MSDLDIEDSRHPTSTAQCSKLNHKPSLFNPCKIDLRPIWTALAVARSSRSRRGSSFGAEIYIATKLAALIAARASAHFSNRMHFSVGFHSSVAKRNKSFSGVSMSLQIMAESKRRDEWLVSINMNLGSKGTAR